MAQGFLIGETLLGQIRDTVKRVDGMPEGGNITRIPTRFESAPAAGGAPPVKLATIAETAIGESWEPGSPRTVQITGSTNTVTVYSAFDRYSPLDLAGGLAYTKSLITKEDGSTATANVVISPPPVPLHSAICTQPEPWQRGDYREVVVLPSAGSTQFRTVVASNIFFDTIDPTDKPMAVGKVGTNYHVITAPPGSGVKLGTRADQSSPWEVGSQRDVTITGTTSVVSVYNVFEHHSEIDDQNGLAFINTAEPGNTGNTAYVMISPSPTPMHKAVPEDPSGGVWQRDQDRGMLVPPSTVTITVSNPFFDDVEVDDKPMAVGKFGTAFHLIAAPGASGVKFGTRTLPGEWSRGSQRPVLIDGTTTEVQVYNKFDHYTDLDAQNGLAFAATKMPGGSTAYAMISPSPIPLHHATTSETGSWAKNATKQLVIPPAIGATVQKTVSVNNPYYDSITLDGKPLAIGKFGTAFNVLTGGVAAAVKKGTFSGGWAKGSQKQVTLASGGGTVSATNSLYKVHGESQGDRVCLVAETNDGWQLVNEAHSCSSGKDGDSLTTEEEELTYTTPDDLRGLIRRGYGGSGGQCMKWTDLKPIHVITEIEFKDDDGNPYIECKVCKIWAAATDLPGDTFFQSLGSGKVKVPVPMADCEEP